MASEVLLCLMFDACEFSKPDQLDLENVHHLMYLFKARENQMHSSLKSKLATAMVYTTVGKKISGVFSGLGESLQSKGIFNTWMLDEQDAIQAFAKSYADRLVSEAFFDVIAENTGKGAAKVGVETVDENRIGASPLVMDTQRADMKHILLKLCHLHMLSRLEADLPWFIQSELLTPHQAEQVSRIRRSAHRMLKAKEG